MEDDKYFINIGELYCFLVLVDRGRRVFVIGLELIRFLVLDYDFCCIYVIFSVIFILEIFSDFGDLFY